MRILILTDEVWNDNLYPGNVLSNWFHEFPAEFSNIYMASGIPDNSCCKNYYQITDTMMMISLFTKKKAGRRIILDSQNNSVDIEEKSTTVIFKYIKKFPIESMRFLRDIIWLTGSYDVEGMTDFLKDAKPDMIFSLRLASRKVIRMERLLVELTKKPIIVFTGDDEFTLKQLRVSPIYWVRRVLLRNDLKRAMSLYSKYFTLSQKQVKLYRHLFHIDAEVLMKTADDVKEIRLKQIHSPIKIIYAGRLYCNRWKTLESVKAALQYINQDRRKIILEIYTHDVISRKIKMKISDGINSYLYPAVSQKQLKSIYLKGDIALHVESFDLKNRFITKFSFSTKIIDCLSSTCAVMAICPKEHTGYEYLKEKRAAICISEPKYIRKVLETIVRNPQILRKYQWRAQKCIEKYHQRSMIQSKLLHVFSSLIEQSYIE